MYYSDARRKLRPRQGCERFLAVPRIPSHMRHSSEPLLVVLYHQQYLELEVYRSGYALPCKLLRSHQHSARYVEG